MAKIKKKAEGILSGIRVLDFGRYIAGPWCAALLGDLGADVIRIEKRAGSEDRYVQPVVAHAESGAGGDGTMFMQMNRNKRGMTLNPRHESGGEIIARLVRTADIVVANLPPRGLEAAGLDYPTLSEIKPEIILTTVSAYGHGGPYSDRPGFDGIAQAMSGAAYMSGWTDPVKSYSPWVDFGTASLSAFATLAALMERSKSGKGQMVEGALLATALSFMGQHLTEEALLKSGRKAIGNRSPYAGPSDIVRTKDGWILVAVTGQPLFERFAQMIGDESLLSDPDFRDDMARGDHSERLSKMLGDWARTRSSEDALEALASARIPAGAVYSPRDALEDRHIQQMGFFKEVDFPGIGAAPIAATPVRLHRTQGDIRRRAPLLGEHTDEILSELGYSESEISAFHENGAV